ncbi:hypothetical protein H257_09102 [Aphanomyces astaci]|uniref:Uncharacterized protein n=1 Tax=Aphanomyces astaci TaxID=112090 RepID=W4GC25_APHAT|nr:hypothetical protein H257_09102 [Aphanomyces astaci]ETV77215.1 hypothetical protein H257_09102 [Aphanomyces astaci]|eukprot:XP_009833521.1 hypothetical protein H257_09102 [Aphanomyces astaci]
MRKANCSANELDASVAVSWIEMTPPMLWKCVDRSRPSSHLARSKRVRCHIRYSLATYRRAMNTPNALSITPMAHALKSTTRRLADEYDARTSPLLRVSDQHRTDRVRYRVSRVS